MTSVASGVATEVSPRPHAQSDAFSTRLDASAAAWLALLPCAALTVAAVLLLGPPAAETLFPPASSFEFLSPTGVAPEPVEQTRYLIALAGPPLLAGATVGFAHRRRPPRGGAGRLAEIATLVQAVAACFVVVCMAAQHAPRFERIYFTTATLAAGVGIAAALMLAARNAAIRARAVHLLRETRPRRVVALLVAAAATVIWTLPAINSAESIRWALDTYDPAFPLDEAFAVINGLTPLVDFSAQYGSLWPFVEALPLLAFGKTLLVFTLVMATLTVAAMLAVYGVLRRASRSAIGGLLLFLPMLATSFFLVRGTSAVHFSFGTYFPMFPLRHVGPFLLAWLTARHLERGGRLWPLFLASSLVALNNVDFGIAAFGATFAALLCRQDAWRRAHVGRLVLSVALGLVGALLLVSLVTLAHAGSLPRLDMLVAYARVYSAGGFGLIPMAGVLGLPLVIFLTYTGAIGVAVVRVLAREPNRVLTGMLAWAGVFGLGSGSYYVARSHSETLQATFSAWTLALALLTIVALPAVSRSSWRRPPIAAVLVLVGLGVATCSLAQVPAPWAQIERIQQRPPGAALSIIDTPYEAPADPAVRRFITSVYDGDGQFVVQRDASIALFWTTGHIVADAYGVRNVVPYTGIESLHTVEQLDDAFAAMRRAGTTTLLIPPNADASFYEALSNRGFRVLTRHGLRASPDGMIGALPGLLIVSGLVKWVDLQGIEQARSR